MPGRCRRFEIYIREGEKWFNNSRHRDSKYRSVFRNILKAAPIVII